MAGRDIFRLAAALLLGAAVAFPLGMMVAGRGSGSPAKEAAKFPADAPVRQVFSPSVANDPYFLNRQREGLELLEQQCRDRKEYCAEAARLSRWLDEQARP